MSANKELHLDEVLQKLGGFGRHQALTLGMLALVYATNSMYNVNYVFAVEDVGYRCKVKLCDDSVAKFSVSWLNGSTSRSSEDNYKECRRSPIIGTDCSDTQLNRTTSENCEEWIYDEPNSFVAEFNLACQEWKQSLVGTVHLFGNMVGLLVQGLISDRLGRKVAAVIAGTMGAVLGIAKSFATSYSVYVLLEGLEAAIGDALSPIFMLSIEFVEKKRAIAYQMILLNCYTSGLIIMPLIAWAVPYWRNFLRVIYAPTLLIVTYAFFLDESVRWLFSKGKKDRAIRLIEKIAKRNGIELDKATLESIEHSEPETNKLGDKSLLLKTFQSRIMLQRFFVCLVWWFTMMLINYGMMISSVLIDGNKYVNFAMLMLMDIPANLVYWLILSKYQRKLPLMLSFVIGGIFCVCQPFVPKGYAWAGLTLFMAFEMFSTFSYNIVYMYTSELFPTYTRNSMHALCSAMGRVGSLIAPQTPLLKSYWAGLPSLMFGVTSLLSGLLACTMPETAHTELPNTVQEAERIG